MRHIAVLCHICAISGAGGEAVEHGGGSPGDALACAQRTKAARGIEGTADTALQTRAMPSGVTLDIDDNVPGR